jgi:2-keto-3-deoxy-L-rhamnonate aldolase RhmA
VNEGAVAPHVTLTLWTADPEVAAAADAAGIDRIGLDLESRGKASRQAGRGAWMSPHVEGDLSAVRSVLGSAQLFVRVDPLGPGTLDQAERVVGRGAQVVMVPMVEDPGGLGDLAAAVAGRARLVALVETATGVDRIAQIAAVPGVDELHLGLNDLSLSLGLANRFAVLAHDASAVVAAAARAARIPFGVGHIGCAHDDRLPVPADLVYAQLPRLGATATLLGRSFLRGAAADLAGSVSATRRRLDEWWNADPAERERARDELARRTREPLPI